ncbi:hypothetical protein [Persephonella sp.]
MFNIVKEKRYLGEIELYRQCDKGGGEQEFRIPFSFEVEDIRDGEIRIKDINPYQINKILPYIKKFKLFFRDKGSVYVVTGNVEKVENDRYYVSLDSGSLYKEKRKFHRFSFCCEDLERFRIRKDDRIFSENACIMEISRTGMKIFTKLHGNLSDCEVCSVESVETDNKFDIRVVEVIEDKNGYVVRAEILDTNINLISYVINGYIKIAEKILKKRE